MSVPAHEIEKLHSDVLAMKAIRNADDGEATKQNPYLVNMIAYHAAQTIEKGMKAIIRSYEPEVAKAAMEKAVKAGLADEEARNAFVLTDDKMKDILESHDTVLLFNTINEVDPEFAKNHEAIDLNKRRFPIYNQLRHGEYSITYPKAIFILYRAANELFNEIEQQYIKETEKTRKDIQEESTVHYAELPTYTNRKEPVESDRTVSVEPKDAPQPKPITAGDLMLVKASLKTADVILASSRGVKSNLYMSNIIAFHAEQAIERTMKAILKEHGGFGDAILKGHNVALLLESVASIRPNFAENYEFIDANKRRLPHIPKAVRYGDDGISYFDAKGIFFVAKRLCEDFEKELIEKSGKTPEEIAEAGRAHYASLEKWRVSRPIPVAPESETAEAKQSEKPEANSAPEATSDTPDVKENNEEIKIKYADEPEEVEGQDSKSPTTPEDI